MNYGKLEMFLLVSVSYYVSLYFLLRRYFGQDLHTTAKNGDVELMERLLVHDPASESEKLDVKAVTKDSLGKTASMLAAERGHQEVLRTLVQAHAQLNLQNSNGNTCLHLAAQRGEVETCRLSVESGADPLIRNLFQFRFADTEQYWLITLTFFRPVVPARTMSTSAGTVEGLFKCEHQRYWLVRFSRGCCRRLCCSSSRPLTS